MKTLNRVLTIASLLVSQAAAAAPSAPASPLVASGACLPQEKWSFNASIPAEWQADFNSALAGKGPAVLSFAQGIQMRRNAKSVTEKAFAEYWISRTLLQFKLHHTAFSGFSTLLSATAEGAAKSDLQAIQLASVSCMSQIRRRYPTLALPESFGKKLAQLSQGASPAQKEILWDAALQHVIARIPGETAASLHKFAVLLEGSGPYESLALGLITASERRHLDSSRELEKFFSAPALPEALKPYRNQAHLVLARNFYTMGQFERASSELKRITKSSNELSAALSELAWSYLMSDRYGEAIGTSMSLQAGGLRHTFTPESQMVMAMALNELCQYPESLHAIDGFKRHYEKPFRWLEAWHKSPQSVAPAGLYPLAVQFIRKQSQVPDRVASEWVKSPFFIAHQDEINSLFEERTASAALGKTGSLEQKKIGGDIRALAKEIKANLRKARARMKAGDSLPDPVRRQLGELRQLITSYKRMRAAAPLWRVILANQTRQARRTEQRIVAKLNDDLRSRSERMYRQIQEIAENNQLIEVEIYNGASQDIIWQNAHPDYKEIAKNFDSEQQKANAGKVWDWGRNPAAAQNSEEGAEIWEDELGSFKANLFDNCENRDRYLTLKKKGTRHAASH